MIVACADSRFRRVALVATILVGAALSGPPSAAAEGTTPVLPQVQALPDAAAITEQVAAATDAVTTLAEAPVPPVPEAPSAEVIPPLPSQAPPPPAAAGGESGPQTPDTTPEPPDTTDSEPEPAQTGDSAGSTATQDQPLNVNVSIRIDSPGDDGAVTQVNEAEAGATGTEPAADTAAEGASATAAASDVAPQPASTVDPAASTTPTTTTEVDAWTWTWSCGESGPEIVLTPSSPGGSVPTIWNWNWNWNCGAESSAPPNTGSQLPGQYQAGATQYQPGNINVSIRIASPGDNGPVVQSNVASAVVAAAPVVAAVAAATVSAATAPVSAATASVPTVSEPVSAPTGLGAVAAPFAAVAEVSASVEDAIGSVAVAVGAVTEVAALAAGLAAPDGLAAAVAGWEAEEIVRRGFAGPAVARSARPVRHEPQAAPAPAPARAAILTESVWTRPVVVPARKLPGAAAQPALDGPNAPRPLAPQPARRSSLPERTPVTAFGLGGGTSGTGGDGSSMFLLLIPFAFALADSARRVTRGLPAIAAQVGNSRRERPG